MLAGVSVRVFSSHQDAVRKCVKVGRMVLPNRDNYSFYEEQFEHYREIQRALPLSIIGWID